MKTPGEYTLEPSDTYIVYVTEQLARQLYYGPAPPPEKELKEKGKSAFDEVDLWEKPPLAFDACAFIDVDGADDSKTGAPEQIPFMSDLVSDATAFLNLQGIGSPVLQSMGVDVAILTDDMAASESLKVENENGELELFVKPLEASITGGQLVVGSALVALSTMALALFA